MATVVDALTVTLGLDNSNFKTGQEQTRAQLNTTRQEAARVGKEMQASGAQAAQFFSQIKTEALSLLGIFLGGKGIENFVRDTTKSMADLGRAAQNIDISPTDLNAFTAAMERMGGSAQSAMSSLEGIARAQQQWKTFGNNPEFNAFLGLIGANPNMKPLDIMSRFSDFTKTQENQPGGIQRIQQAGAGIGLDQATINSIIQLTKTSTLSEQMNVSREYITVTKRMTDEFASLQTGLTSLSQAMDGLAIKILDPLVPSLDRLARRMADTIAHAPEEAKKVADAIKAQGEFDQKNMPAPTGANKFVNDLLAGGSGQVTSSGWWSYLFGDDIQQDRARVRNVPPSRSQGVPVTPGPGPRANDSDPRGIRNNNPLNLSYLPGQGADASDGRFGIYRSMESGVSANVNQILSYRDRHGLNTIEGIINRWAPPGENNTSDYIRSVSNSMGAAPNAKLDLDNPDVMTALINGMSRVENGGRVPDPTAVQRGVRNSLSANNRRQMTPQMGPQVPSQVPTEDPAKNNPAFFILPGSASGPRSQSEDNSTAITIGNINIHTQATDAKGIVGSLRNEIANVGNRGLN